MNGATFAAAVAAIAVTLPCAQPSMPTMAEVEHFIDNRFVGRQAFGTKICEEIR